MNQYTINVYSNEWSRQTGIDIDFSVGTAGFGSDVVTDIAHIQWKKDSVTVPLSKLTASVERGVDLIVLNLIETCKLLHRNETTEVTIVKDVTDSYKRYSFEHKGKKVAILSHMTGVYVDDRRFRNVLSAFKENRSGIS